MLPVDDLSAGAGCPHKHDYRLEGLFGPKDTVASECRPRGGERLALFDGLCAGLTDCGRNGYEDNDY